MLSQPFPPHVIFSKTGLPICFFFSTRDKMPRGAATLHVLCDVRLDLRADPRASRAHVVPLPPGAALGELGLGPGALLTAVPRAQLLRDLRGRGGAMNRGGRVGREARRHGELPAELEPARGKGSAAGAGGHFQWQQPPNRAVLTLAQRPCFTY